MCQDSDHNCDSCKPDSVEGHARHREVNAVEAPTYNIVFQTLVTNEVDMVGQLAYCLYKRSKQQYVREFERLNGRRATESELLTHVACSEIPALGIYLEKAQLAFSEVLRRVSAEKQREVERHFKDHLWQLVRRYRPEGFGEKSWLLLKALTFGGFSGALGNFMTTLLVLLLLFGAATSTSRDEFSRSAKESLISGLAEVIGVTVSITRSPPEQALDPLP